MNGLNGPAGRQVVYMIVAMVIAKIGADAASAEQWTTVVMAVIGVVGPLLAALNVNKGKGTSPVGPTGGIPTGSLGLPTYDMASTNETAGRHALVEGAR